MVFVGQIDLADLPAEPQTGARAPHLPEQGRLLMFFSSRPEYDVPARCLVLDEQAASDATPRPTPPNMPNLRDLGFWIDATTFPRWDVEVQPFLDQPNGTPGFPRVAARDDIDRTDWLRTWADAALEAETTAKWLGIYLGHRQGNLEYQRKNPPSSKPRAYKRETWEKNVASMTLFVERGPQFIQKVTAWATHCAAQPRHLPVDRAALQEHFIARRAHAAPMQNYPEKQALMSGYGSVFSMLRLNLENFEADASGVFNFSVVPPEHRDAVAAEVTSWRGITLFGHGEDFENYSQDMSSLDPVFILPGDNLLATQTEHEAGFSGWFQPGALANGDTTGVLYRHCAV